MQVKAVTHRLITFLVVLLSCLGLALSVQAQEGAGGRAYIIEVKGPVTPVVQAYIGRGIEQARADGAACLIVMLNTPGGSLSVTREIVEVMQAAPLPIIVYVAPSGATAASAGTILTLAGHLAAMAPGTSIGAASPVSGQGEELGETERRKAENIVVADLKALTEGRSPEARAWVERAVREAAALTANEALEVGVIDVVAASPTELLQAIDGRQVTVAGRQETLHTASLTLERLPMNAIEQFLHVILDPNIAFILMTLGVNALLFELSSPGGYVAGVVGAICLLLGLFALGVLSVNWAGLGLIALAFILFVADIKAPTHGILTALGLFCFVLGSLVLFNSPIYRVSRVLIGSVAIFTSGFFAFVVAKAVSAQHRRATTGRDALVGSVGEARQLLDPEGMVFIHGELWQARSCTGLIAAGTPVRVIATKGLRLLVEPVPGAGAPGGEAV